MMMKKTFTYPLSSDLWTSNTVCITAPTACGCLPDLWNRSHESQITGKQSNFFPHHFL